MLRSAFYKIVIAVLAVAVLYLVYITFYTQIPIDGGQSGFSNKKEKEVVPSSVSEDISHIASSTQKVEEVPLIINNVKEEAQNLKEVVSTAQIKAKVVSTSSIIKTQDQSMKVITVTSTTTPSSTSTAPQATTSTSAQATTTKLVVTTGCTPYSGGIESQIESAINEVRKSRGLLELKVCKELRNVALAKYNDIVSQNNFTHDWAGGKLLQNVIRSYGYNPKNWGEILVYGSDFITGQDYVDAWMESASHANIILTPSYTHVGVAVGPWSDDGVAVQIGVAEFGESK